ncbi:unnamed protein product [Chondrus crispus]|uniref:Ribosomal protein L1 n=1 Tax=Chondrus crispus TaxID=2769 RepID=R7QLF3_CHOCR|nr:unnamed protein product [Chondrus crispus]CDF38593.1 unnamed protein product [Chondrus crispus]|eukprot:XP_005718498.1 unnamed protein product [Chondrus crispus]
MGTHRLRKEYGTHEGRRELAKQYDLFLVDNRVSPMMPKLLGNTFLQARKMPLQVDIRSGNLNGISKALRSTAFTLRQGTSSTLRVGKIDLTLDQNVENVHMAVDGVVKRLPGGWDDVQSLIIKTNKSPALPIFSALPTMSKSLLRYEMKSANKSGDSTKAREKDHMEQITGDPVVATAKDSSMDAESKPGEVPEGKAPSLPSTQETASGTKKSKKKAPRKGTKRAGKRSASENSNNKDEVNGDVAVHKETGNEKTGDYDSPGENIRTTENEEEVEQPIVQTEASKKSQKMDKRVEKKAKSKDVSREVHSALGNETESKVQRKSARRSNKSPAKKNANDEGVLVEKQANIPVTKKGKASKGMTKRKKDSSDPSNEADATVDSDAATKPSETEKRPASARRVKRGQSKLDESSAKAARRSEVKTADATPIATRRTRPRSASSNETPVERTKSVRKTKLTAADEESQTLPIRRSARKRAPPTEVYDMDSKAAPRSPKQTPSRSIRKVRKAKK